MAEESELPDQEDRPGYYLKRVNHNNPCPLRLDSSKVPIAGKTRYFEPMLIINSPILTNAIYAWVFFDKKDANWYIVKNEGVTVEMVLVNGVQLTGIDPCRLVVDDVIELGTSGKGGHEYVVFSDARDRQVSMPDVEVLRSRSMEGRFRDEMVFSRRFGSENDCVFCVMESRIHDAYMACFKCFSRLSCLDRDEVCARDRKRLKRSSSVAILNLGFSALTTNLLISNFDGNGTEVVFTGLKAKVAFQGHCNDVEFAISGSKVVFKGNGNTVLFTGSNNRLYFQGSGNRVTFQGSDNRVYFNEHGNRVTFQGTGNRVRFNKSANRVTFEGCHNQLFFKNAGNWVAFQGTRNKLDFKRFGNRVNFEGCDNLLSFLGPGNRVAFDGYSNTIVMEGFDNHLSRIVSDKEFVVEISGDVFPADEDRDRDFEIDRSSNRLDFDKRTNHFSMDGYNIVSKYGGGNTTLLDEHERLLPITFPEDFRYRLANLNVWTYGHTASIFQVDDNKVSQPRRMNEFQPDVETEAAVQSAIEELLADVRRDGKIFGPGITINNNNTFVDGDGNQVLVGSSSTGTTNALSAILICVVIIGLTVLHARRWP